MWCLTQVGSGRGTSLIESLWQSVPRICGPHHDQAITCFREGLALLGRRQQKQPLPIPWGFLCPALCRGTGAQRGQLLSTLTRRDTAQPGFCPGLCTPTPSPGGQVLDLSSATPTQCDIFTAHAGSVKAWME